MSASALAPERTRARNASLGTTAASLGAIVVLVGAIMLAAGGRSQSDGPPLAVSAITSLPPAPESAARAIAEPVSRVEANGSDTSKSAPGRPITRAESVEAEPRPEVSIAPDSVPNRIASVAANAAVAAGADGTAVESAAPAQALAAAPTPVEVATRPCCSEGSPGLFVHAKSAFDPWTRKPSYFDAAWMAANYESMLVYSPYFDSRLGWFDRGVAYLDTFAIYVDTERDQRFVNHPDWVLRDAQGSPLYIDYACHKPGGCPQRAADVGNDEFRADFLRRIGRLVDRGYTGLWLDDVNMVWRISDRLGDRRLPMNPRTGREMTLDEWQLSLTELLELVRREYPDLTIMHNVIWYADSPSFDNTYIDRQIAATDYVFLERGATDAGLVKGASRFGIRTLLLFVDRVHRLGANVVLADESGGREKEQVFNHAATLLVSNGNDLFGTETYDMVAPGSYWKGFDVDLGVAFGVGYEWNRRLRRAFDPGRVLLAEPGVGPRSVDLDGEYTDSHGSSVGRAELRGGEALILTAS